jgi:GH18 family chitinase
MFDMKLIPFFLTLILLASCGRSAAPLIPPEPASVTTTSPTLTALPAPRAFAVIGYFPDYRQLNPAWTEHLTDIIYFSAEPRADGTLDTSRLSEETWQALNELKLKNGIHMHLSVGGWERSSAFAPMTADPLTRRVFINTLIEFALTHNLNGIDFDWEFPEDKTEFDNYILFLTETKTAFSKYDLIVSVALSPDPSFPLASFAVVDRVHVMSYDRDAQHSTYEQAVKDLQLFLDAGLPPEKLILGIPFYGRNIQPPYRVLAYNEIMQQYHPAFNVDEVDGMYYNGVETVQRKTCYAMRESTGGVMIWELAHDTLDETSLLQKIFEISIGRKPC